MTNPNIGPIFGAISVDGIPQIARSVEVVRMWVQHQGTGTFFINAGNLETPEMFGILMVDCVRHGARAFAAELGISESDALDRIWEGVDRERDDPTRPDPVTIRDGSGDLH